MQLPEYLSIAFPGLLLQPALFYCWEPALRFELNACSEGSSYDESRQRQTVMQRAMTLYEDVFRPDDLTFVVSGQVRYRNVALASKHLRHGPQRNFGSSIFTLSRTHSLGLRRVAGRLRAVTEDNRELQETTTYHWASIAPRKVNYRFVLEALANDHYYRRRPSIDGDSYFVNQTRNIIFMMYGDRGLDIIASGRESLQPFYEKYNDWLLDYDRERMDRMFEKMQRPLMEGYVSGAPFSSRSD